MIHCIIERTLQDVNRTCNDVDGTNAYLILNNRPKIYLHRLKMVDTVEKIEVIQLVLKPKVRECRRSEHEMGLRISGKLKAIEVV